MFCEQCGKQLREGSRFCPYCGANQSGILSEEENGTAPVLREQRARSAASGSGTGASRPARGRTGKKKSKAPLIIALVLVLALLAGGGYLLYRNVIFPRQTVKNAEALVQYLRESPARDNGEDFGRRIGLYDKDYYAILSNRDAELIVKDYLREPYGRGDYHTWVHALYMLQSCGLYGSSNEVADIVERKDIEDLCGLGGGVNLNSGWFSNSDHVYEIYSDSPGYRDPELFDVYTWGDVMAVRSHEYGWTLFYRGIKMDVWGDTRWSTTSADTIQYHFRNSRQLGDLLIFPYEDGFSYDVYYVLDTSTGDYFTAGYDF